MAGFWIVIMFGWIGIVILIALAVVVLVNIVCYLFESLAINEYMKRMSLKGRFKAFVPCYNKYVLGVMSDNPWLGIIEAVVNGIKLLSLLALYVSPEGWFEYAFVLFVITALLSFVLNTIMASEIFYLFTKNRAIYTALSIVTLGIARPIFLFVFMNRSKGYEQRRQIVG